MKNIVFDDKIVRKALKKYREAANQKEMDAGYSGAMSDFGAGEMRREATAYENGLDRIVPGFLYEYVKQVERDSDVDYARYLELKKKFE